jgi:hypothetical protein
MGSAAADDFAHCDCERKQATGGRVKCEGVVFTVTEGNEVALVTRGGATRALGSESYLDASTGTRHHFVDVQGKAEDALLGVRARGPALHRRLPEVFLGFSDDTIVHCA